MLIQQYLYIDKLLDSSLPHDLLNEYNEPHPSSFRNLEVPGTITEEPRSTGSPGGAEEGNPPLSASSGHTSLTAVSSAAVLSSPTAKKVKRTPKDIYRPTETTPLLERENNVNAHYLGGDPDEVVSEDGEDDEPKPEIPWLEDDDVDSDSPIVTAAIYVNFAANALLLAGKIAVIVTTPSVSVLASLVDAVLDFLSTVSIIREYVGLEGAEADCFDAGYCVDNHMADQQPRLVSLSCRPAEVCWAVLMVFSQQPIMCIFADESDRLEPLGVLVFSVIMITSFVQVMLEAFQRLMSSEHEIVEL